MEGVNDQPFKPIKRCWEYWATDYHGTRCRHCSVFHYEVNECFTARDNPNRQCPINCHECHYFSEYYGPRVAFIHQIDKPAAIYKGLYLWSGNKYWAEFCGVDVEKLIGAGIEEFIHPDSLKTFLNYDKRRTQGDTTVPDRHQVDFHNKSNGKVSVYLTISPLARPASAWLAIADDVKLET